MTTTQTDEIKTWQQRLEETCPALGPMHIHACVEEVNDAMQAEINDLRVALQEQAREGEVVAPNGKLTVTLQDTPTELERAQYKRLLEAACVALGEINEALGLDPEDGGAEPILDAIEELRAALKARETVTCECGRTHKSTSYGWKWEDA